MPDARAVLRVIDELLWSLRRAGFVVSTAESLECARALDALGLAERRQVREAMAAVILKNARRRARFDAAFDAFFSSERGRPTLWERLAAQGFAGSELDALRELLEAFGKTHDNGLALLHGGAELDRLLQLADVARSLDAMQSELQLGFYTHRVLQQLGVARTRERLSGLRARLGDALGAERAAALVAAIERELDRIADEIRAHVRGTLERRAREASPTARAQEKDFVSLSDAEVEEVRRSVRRFVERLRGGERVRRRRSARGRIDPHKTLRLAMGTGGVPFRLARKRRGRQKPKLVLLCDVSDSMRAVARFMLELTYSAQELFERTRTFVFVSDIGETTEIFAREPLRAALAQAYGGGVVSVAENSNYGRVLRRFRERWLGEIDRRTTVVVLGDGRTNYHDDAADVLDEIRGRARALLWLSPEGRAGWAVGDSAMSRYAPKCTRVLEVRNAAELEEGARTMVAIR
jgi:uncharacterized protein with von Willebrand factor type A (vWA) domain